MKLILPLLPLCVIFLFVFLYNKKHHRSIIWEGKITSKFKYLLGILLLVWAGSSLIIDPNFYMDSNRGNSLFTSGRQFGVALLFFGYMLADESFLDNKNIKNRSHIKDFVCFRKAAKFFYVMFCITAILSGAYGFLTRTCWGLFETQYISDTFLWLAELGWCIVGMIGIWAYFKYIRYWN